MNKINELTCFSLGCSFTTFSEAELMEHELKHEAKFEKVNDPNESECEDCESSPCKCNKDNQSGETEINDCV